MFNVILSFLIVVPAATLCLYPMKNKLRFRLWQTLLTMNILLTVVVLVISALAVRYRFDPNMLLLPVLFLLFAAYNYTLEVHISKSIAVFCDVISLMSIFGTYAVCFDASRHPNLGANAYSPDYALMHLSLGIAAAILLAFPFTRYGSYLIDHVDINRVWYWTLPFSILLLVINLSMRPGQYATFHAGGVSQAVLQIVTALLAVWCLMHVIFYLIVSGIISTAKMLDEKRLLEMQESQFIAQQRYMEETARVRHDFRQTIRTLQELSRSGDLSAIKAYIDQYTDSLPNNETTSFCENHAVNAMLNHYWNRAGQEHIRMSIHTELPNDIGIREYDLCGMIGNILDNAIAACEDVQGPDRYIDLAATVKNNRQLIIVATNTHGGKLKEKGGTYLSTHRDGNGLGLASVYSTAEKYGGTAAFEHDEKLFYSNILIPLKPA